MEIAHVKMLFVYKCYFKNDFISQLCKIFEFFRIFTQLKLNENRYIDTMLFTLY